MSLNIKLKRSAVLGSLPTPGQLEDGEIGVNYNVDDPALYIKNSAGAVIRLAGTNAVTDLWARNGTTISPADAGDDVEIGGGNIELNSSGQIISTGMIKPGFLYIDNANSAWESIQLANSGTKKLTMTAGGSIDAAGSVSIGGSSSVPNIKLFDSGTGIFGVNPYQGAGTGVAVINAGIVRASAVSGSPLWQGYKNGETTDTSRITSQGSATFAGPVSAGSANTALTTTTGVTCNSTGYVLTQREAGNNSFVWRGYLGTDITSSILADGSTSFAGSITADGQIRTNDKFFAIDPVGAQNSRLTIEPTDDAVLITANNTAATGRDIFFDLGSNGNSLNIGGSTSVPAIELNSNGSASFAGLLRGGTIRPLDPDSAAVPGLCVYNDPDTGFYRPSSNNIGIATGGVERVRVNSTGLSVGGTLPSAPAIELKSIGTIVAVNNITAGDFQTSATTTTGARLGASGYLYVQKEAGSGGIVNRVYQGDLIKTEYRADGRQWTAGNISIGGEYGGTPEITLTASDGSATFASDITCTDNSKGLVLKSPDGTSFRLSVANDGTLSASAV